MRNGADGSGTATTGSGVTARELWLIAVAAIAVRMVMSLATILITGDDWRTFAELRDGEQFMAFAQAWIDPDVAVDDYTLRLFPLQPLLTGLLHAAGVPLTTAAVTPSWLLAGLAAALSAMLFRDRRVGWGMVLLTPTWLINSSLISNEPLMLTLTLIGGLMLVRRDRIGETGRLGWPRSTIGGVSFGLAGLARPVAVFGALGAFAASVIRGDWKRGVATGVIAVIVLGVGLAVVRARFGSAFVSYAGYTSHEQAYGGGMFTWPFHALLTVPGRDGVPLWKIGWIWAHVGLVLLGCVLAAVQLWRADGAGDRGRAHLAFWWLIGNTIFVLCLEGRWAFGEFHRFIVPALPPLLYVGRGLLPTGRWWWWLPLGGASIALGLLGFADLI